MKIKEKKKKSEPRAKKIEVNCPHCGVTLDVYPETIINCPACVKTFFWAPN